MIYRLLANLVLILHMCFVVFVICGGLLALRWRKLIWFHAPAAVWGASTEFLGLICPLTPLEVMLRQLGGSSGYQTGFIDHYITAVLYPSGLTRHLQIWLGIAAVVPNAALYVYILAHATRGGPGRSR